MTGAAGGAGPDPRAAARAEEDALVDAFVLAARRERWKGMLANPKRRPKAIVDLYRFLDFVDPRWVVPIPPADQNPAAIERELRRRGAGTACHVISDHGQHDGERMPLRTALEALVGLGACTLLSCVPGRLAYWEGETENERCILARPAVPKRR